MVGSVRSELTEADAFVQHVKNSEYLMCAELLEFLRKRFDDTRFMYNVMTKSGDQWKELPMMFIATFQKRMLVILDVFQRKGPKIIPQHLYTFSEYGQCSAQAPEYQPIRNFVQALMNSWEDNS